MRIGYLLGGVACLLYAALVGYFVGTKKSPGLLKLVKVKLSKNTSDDAYAIISAGVVLAVGISLFVFGAIQSAV